MKVIWITPQLPCLRGGGHVRQYHLIKRLRERCEVTVVSLATPDELAEASALEALGIRTAVVPFDPNPPIGPWRRRLRTWRRHLLDPRPNYAFIYPLDELQTAIRQTLDTFQPDLAQLEHLFVAPCATVLGTLPWVLTAHNVESQSARRNRALSIRWIDQAVGQLETAKLARWERRWVRRSAACIAMSEGDAAALRSMAPSTPVFVVPNGVDTAYFAPPDGPDVERRDVLFLGNLGYAPNADAVMYFTREILPAIQSAVTDLRFRIVGPNAPPDVVGLGSLPGVDYVGFVPDVRRELWRAAVSVVPLRSGGGTRLKILESLAAGCCVVSTTIGAEGLDLVDGREIVLADDPAAFAAATAHLLRNALHREKVALAGRTAVQLRYDWDGISPMQERVYSFAGVTPS